METTARNRTIGGIVIAATILILLLVLFSCTVNSEPQGYGYTLARDDNGYFVTVDVSEDERIPPEWSCQPKKDAFRMLTCVFRVDGAQEPKADDLTKQEIEALVRQEVERIKDTPQIEPKQEPDRQSGDSPIDWPNWIMAGVAVVTFGWLMFTQRDHVPALIAGVRRLCAWLRRGLATRARSVGAGPGPLRHARGWRPARRRS